MVTDATIPRRFTGLSAFPLTPLIDDRLDEIAYARLITRLAQAGVNSITALGSTGSYAYLSREERAAAAQIAVEHAGDVPVFVGVGALRTSHVQTLVDDAHDAGAKGILLAPLTYQTHTDEDVYSLFADISRGSTVPIIVYDNPGTTHFTFTDELYARISALPRVASIKIPSLPKGPAGARRVEALRHILAPNVTIGISGDAAGAHGLTAGCDAWYSVIGGTLPHIALEITRLAQSGGDHAAIEASSRLLPLWRLFELHGSLRVCAAIIEHYGLATRSSLPLPIRGLDDRERDRVIAVVERLGISTNA